MPAKPCEELRKCTLRCPVGDHAAYNVEHSPQRTTSSPLISTVGYLDTIIIIMDARHGSTLRPSSVGG